MSVNKATISNLDKNYKLPENLDKDVLKYVVGKIQVIMIDLIANINAFFSTIKSFFNGTPYKKDGFKATINLRIKDETNEKKSLEFKKPIQIATNDIQNKFIEVLNSDTKVLKPSALKKIPLAFDLCEAIVSQEKLYKIELILKNIKKPYARYYVLQIAKDLKTSDEIKNFLQGKYKEAEKAISLLEENLNASRAQKIDTEVIEDKKEAANLINNVNGVSSSSIEKIPTEEETLDEKPSIISDQKLKEEKKHDTNSNSISWKKVALIAAGVVLAAGAIYSYYNWESSSPVVDSPILDSPANNNSLVDVTIEDVKNGICNVFQNATQIVSSTTQNVTNVFKDTCPTVDTPIIEDMKNGICNIFQNATQIASSTTQNVPNVFKDTYPAVDIPIIEEVKNGICNIFQNATQIVSSTTKSITNVFNNKYPISNNTCSLAETPKVGVDAANSISTSDGADEIADFVFGMFTKGFQASASIGN